MEDKFTINFREALKYSQISQSTLAQKVGVSKQSISDFKNGRSFPSIQTLSLICQVLDVSADYLLGIDNKNI